MLVDVAGQPSRADLSPSHGYGYGDFGLSDIPVVENVGGHSNPDDDPSNTLKPIAEKYRDVEVPCVAEPGDVVFFGGHVFHRSLRNRSETRMRRCLVSHYCNARSYTRGRWGTSTTSSPAEIPTFSFSVPKVRNSLRCPRSGASVDQRQRVRTHDDDGDAGRDDGRGNPVHRSSRRLAALRAREAICDLALRPNCKRALHRSRLESERNRAKFGSRYRGPFGGSSPSRLR